MADPLDPAAIEAKRERIVHRLATSGGRRRSSGATAYAKKLKAGRSSIQVPDGDVIVAYNFDVANGSTSEHVITVPLEPKGDEVRAQEVSDEQLVAAAHKKAKADAKSRNKIKKSTGSNIRTQDVTVGWNDWDLVDKSNNSRIGVENETGWDVEWRRSRQEPDKHGIRATTSMDPAGYRWHGKWSNHSAKSTLDFNESNVSVDVRNYGPGSTIGSGASGFEVQVTSERFLNVGFSSSETDSDLQVLDKSDVYGEEKVVHDYNINNELRQSTVRMNCAAVGDISSRDGTFANVDLKTKYDALVRYNINKSIDFSW